MKVSHTVTQDSRRSRFPAGKRQRLAEAIARFGLVAPLQAMHDRGRQTLTVLAYHRIAPLDDAARYPLDIDLISASPEDFDAQMRYLREHQHPVSLDQIIEHLNGGTPLPPRAVAVTFDDGFRDTFRHAFPALRAHRIPACVFVTTGCVDSGEPFWFELTAHLMMRIAPHSIRLPALAEGLPSGDDLAHRRLSIKTLHAALKMIPDADRAALVKEWAARFRTDIDPSIIELSHPITWDEIEAMSHAGIAFGSHTLTHPNLTQLTDEALRRELVESRRILSARIGQTVRTIAYPFGTPGTYDERVMRHAAQAGYELGVSYIAGTNWPDDLRRFELRRKGVSFWMSLDYFRTQLALPEWVQ